VPTLAQVRAAIAAAGETS